MQKEPKKEQKTPSLPFTHSTIGEWGKELYKINLIPYRQGDSPITRLHTHECCEFGLCLEGNGIFIVGGQVFPFRGGDCTFIPARVPHLAQSSPGTESCWYWLYPDLSRLLLWAPELAGIDRFGDFPAEPNQSIRALFETARSESDVFTGKQLAAQLALFAIELHRNYEPESTDSSPLLARIRPALDWMAHDCSREIPVGKLAAKCSLSENQFRRVFFQATGKRPLEYLHQLRIATAISLLRENTLPLHEIAERCGYSSLSSFNRQFAKHAETSPGRFRRKGSKA